MSGKERVLLNDEEAMKVIGGVLCYDCTVGQPYYYVWSDENQDKVYKFNPSDITKIGQTIFYECYGKSDEETLNHLASKGIIW